MNRDNPWLGPIVIAIGALALLVWLGSIQARSAEFDPWIIRLVARDANGVVAIQEYRPNDQEHEFKTEEECNKLVSSTEFLTQVAAPGIWYMFAKYGKDIMVQGPECVLSSENDKLLQLLRIRKGQEL